MDPPVSPEPGETPPMGTPPPPPVGGPGATMPGDVPPETLVIPAMGVTPPPPGTPPPGTPVPGAFPPEGPQPWYKEHATLLVILGVGAGLAILLILLFWILDGGDEEVTSETLPAVTSTSVPASTSVPGTTVPATTVAPTTAAPTTVPATTVPATTVPATTVPATTVAATTVPATTVPATTVPGTSVPPSVPTDATPADVLSANPDQFGTFWEWILDAGLDDELATPGESFTVFAPTNSALEGITPPTDQDELEDLINSYIVSDDALSTAMIFDGERTEIEAEEGTIEVDQTAMTVGEATIVHLDLEAAGDPNGFVHGIDRLFTP
jgi:uncharacterized surface protein with fasciclin (FAS1) repeats